MSFPDAECVPAGVDRARIDQHVAMAKDGAAHVEGLIRARIPDAGPDVVGGLMDAYGSSVWAPTRSPSIDYSAWGDWEAWEHCAIDQKSIIPASNPVAPGPVPTGDWVAVNMKNPAQQIGYPSPNAVTKAEMFAVMRNEGKPTRVVSSNGSFRESALDYEKVKARVEAEIARFPSGSGSEA